MLTYCLKCKRNTKSKDAKMIKTVTVKNQDSGKNKKQKDY